MSKPEPVDNPGGSDEKLLIFGWITTILGLPADGDPAKYNELTDRLYELQQAHHKPQPTADAGELREALTICMRLEKQATGPHGPAAYKVSASEEEKIDALERLIESECAARERAAIESFIGSKDDGVIVFTSDGFAADEHDINRNDPTYFAIHTELVDVSNWVKAGGKLELHHIDSSAERIFRAMRQEQRQRLAHLKSNQEGEADE